MTLRMADGPPSNLPKGMDALAGFVNLSGIGITFPQVRILATAQQIIAFSITTNGSPAMCADVEKGAMTDWRGYDYGYCSVSNVNNMIATYGRPRKLWTAHYTGVAHICSPECWLGLVTTADGTQWIDHGGWDESLLSDNFFAPPSTLKEDEMTNWEAGGQTHVTGIIGSVAYHWYQNTAGTAPANAPANYYQWHVEELPMP